MAEARPWRLLFVCTANICRSPMAEGLAASYAIASGKDVEVRSAGTHGMVGAPAAPHSVAVCGELGVNLGEHVAQGVSAELIEWADYVLCMEYAHVEFMREKFVVLGEKGVLLGTFGGTMDIADPYGGWKFQYRWSRDEIKRCVESFVDRLPVRKAVP